MVTTIRSCVPTRMRMTGTSARSVGTLARSVATLRRFVPTSSDGVVMQRLCVATHT
jgi:hypothetical protein